MTATTPNSPTPPPRRSLRTVLLATGAVVLVAIVVGAILIVGDAIGGKRSDASAFYSITESFDSVRVNTEAADVTVRYASVGSAQLIFHQGTQVRSATLHHAVVGRVLTVTETVSGSLPFGWIAADATTLEIVLPKSEETRPMDLDTTIQAGNLDLNGRFAALTVASNAGNVTLHGGARSLNLKDQSGNVTATGYTLHGPVISTTTAGDSHFEFIALPSRATLSASAGDIWFSVPKGAYEVSGRSLAGTVHQNVTSTPGASRVYTLRDNAGNIVVANS
jgi:hypothetical protein